MINQIVVRYVVSTKDLFEHKNKSGSTKIVASSASLIFQAELACMKIISANYGEELTSVGIFFSVYHSAAARLNDKLIIKCVEKRKIFDTVIFNFEIYCNDRKIMHGELRRQILHSDD